MYNIKYQDDDLIMLIEWADGLPVIHHEIYNWKLSTHKKMRNAFNDIVKELKEDGFDVLYSYYDVHNESVKKFVDKYGFTPCGEVNNYIVVVKEL